MGQYDAFKQQVVATAQQLVERGYLKGTGGNLSLRVTGRNAFAITPSNYDYTKMVPEDVCVLDLETHVLEGARKPSIESALHAVVYQVRADVRIVIHTHQVYASTLALIDAPIPALYDEQVRYLGRSVEVIPYAPSGTPFLKTNVRAKVRNGHNAYILKNHGALVFAADIERAVSNVELLEKCALAYLLALCSGRTVSRIPLAVREIAFAQLRKDEQRLGQPGQDGATS